MSLYVQHEKSGDSDRTLLISEMIAARSDLEATAPYALTTATAILGLRSSSSLRM
ncbi:Uncharacterised protein [Mycobacteroides abscessus subsp. abscessus]|nr:Uncharacterised protein [Mycobacteroides abscessus subsp. abscessus]SHZ73570.1 Uncharacterised protein [Mycobacteroides abscessus subsp. abscessus]